MFCEVQRSPTELEAEFGRSWQKSVKLSGANRISPELGETGFSSAMIGGAWRMLLLSDKIEVARWRPAVFGENRWRSADLNETR